jgi:hypothetical protein
MTCSGSVLDGDCSIIGVADPLQDADKDMKATKNNSQSARNGLFTIDFCIFHQSSLACPDMPR